MMTIFGSASSERWSIGRAHRSPSASGPITCTTVTSGSWPAAASCLRVRSTWPSFSSSLSSALSGMRSAPFRWKARAISRLPTGPSLSRMKARTCSLVGKGTCFAPRFLPRSTKGASSSACGLSGLRCFELDFNKGELVFVGVDDVMLDADRTVIGFPRCQFREPLRFPVVDLQFPGGQRHHDIVVAVPVPGGLRPRREPPFGDEHAVIVDLDGGLGRRAGHAKHLSFAAQ